MKEWINTCSRYFYQQSAGLLLIRLSIGFIFLTHGLTKLHDLDKFITMLGHIGLAPWVVVFIAWLEVIGGIALILGILTRVFAVTFGIQMLVALFLTGALGDGFFMKHDLEAVLMFASFGIALTGSGALALFPMECKVCNGMLCKGECAHMSSEQ